jgi:hypothetical protein
MISPVIADRLENGLASAAMLPLQFALMENYLQLRIAPIREFQDSRAQRISGQMRKPCRSGAAYSNRRIRVKIFGILSERGQASPA